MACHGTTLPENDYGCYLCTMSKFKVQKTESEWRQILTDEEYRILREKGTESPGSGKYYHFNETGTYHCAACRHPLFHSESKYHSGSGWPSFYDAVDRKHIHIEVDYKLGVPREEIMCGNCGSHLGHVFPDGPKPTGLRYCVNSLSLEFEDQKLDK